jgi:2-polyprenyl-3-methyl-5-hydroxy-6-metoxy-1,4-benzoquinol methylase
VAFEELKQKQSVVWGTGPYQNITETVTDIHEKVIERLDPRPGVKWLDLATGTGAVAELAAKRGAEVTGVDLAPALIETAQERAGEQGLDIDYRVGDCDTSSSRTALSTSSPRRAGSCSRPTTRRPHASSAGSSSQEGG